MKAFALLAATVLICVGCIDHVRHSKEQVLREDLFTLRQSIDQFTQDQKRAPQSLEELVSYRYLQHIPSDPFTNSPVTWQLIYSDPVQTPQDTPASPPSGIRKLKSIIDVRSGSDQTAADGTRYKDW